MKLSEAVLNIVNRALKYVRQAYDLVESHSCWRGVHNHCKKKKRKERKNSKDFAANAEYATLFHNQMNAFSFFFFKWSAKAQVPYLSLQAEVCVYLLDCQSVCLNIFVQCKVSRQQLDCHWIISIT